MVYRLCQPGIGLASRASGQSAAYRVGQRGIEQVSRISAFVRRCLADSTHGVSQRVGLVTKVPRKLTSSESPGRFRFRFPIQWHVHQLGFGQGSLVVVSISGRCLSSDDCCCRRVIAQTPTLSVPVSSAVSSHNRNRKSKREIRTHQRRMVLRILEINRRRKHGGTPKLTNERRSRSFVSFRHSRGVQRFGALGWLPREPLRLRSAAAVGA